MVIAPASRVRATLFLLLLALGGRTDNDNGDGRLLEAVFGDGSWQKTVDSLQVAATRTDHEHGRLVYPDLDCVSVLGRRGN